MGFRTGARAREFPADAGILARHSHGSACAVKVPEITSRGRGGATPAADATSLTMDELTYQRWDGDLLAEERFYYDPVQRTRKPTRSPPDPDPAMLGP
jgi:hypothetical protein